MTKAPTLTAADYKKAELLKMRAAKAKALDACFIHTNLDSRPRGVTLEAQMDNVYRGQWIVAPNAAGKTAYGSREIAWWFKGNHPYKKRLPEWGDQPLFIIITSKTTTIIQQEIWLNKLKPLIEGCYEIEKEDKECVRLVVNPTNGNRILFIPHNDAFHARERLQGFTIHIAWVDEMPDDSSFLSELLFRLRAGDKLDKEAPLSGWFYGTFTPLVEDDGVRQLVESATFPFKKRVFRLEDNPYFDNFTSEELDTWVRQRCQDDVEFMARRYGHWYHTSERVFGGYLPTRNRVKLPFEYSPSLLHAVIVDPAASGKVGVSLAVLAPLQVPQPHPARKGEFVMADQWWVVRSKKLSGAAASLLVKDIEKEFASGVNVAADGRICDCAPSGFYKEAQLQGLPYRPYRKKNDKKKESIEATNKALYNGLLMLADTPETEELHKELLSAKWKENETEIKNSNSFHCADTLRYLWEMKPLRVSVAPAPGTYTQAIKQAWKREEAARAEAEEKARKKKQRLMPSRAWARPMR